MNQKNNFNKFILLLLFIISFVIRHYGIKTKALWFDEIDLWQTALEGTPSTDAPLPSVLLYCFFKLTSVSTYNFYLLPVIIGAVTILTTYLLSKKIEQNYFYNLTCAAFITFSPLAIYYSQEGRAYSLFLFLASLLYASFLNAYYNNLFKNWVIYSLFALLACLTHLIAYQIIFVFGLFMLVICFVPGISLDDRKLKFRKFYLFSMASIVAGFFAFLDALSEKSNLNVIRYSKHYTGSVFEFLINVFSGLSFTFKIERYHWSLYLIPIIFCAIYVIGIKELIKKNKIDMALLWLLALFVPTLLMYCSLGKMYNWTWLRYISHLLLPFGLIFCLGLTSLIGKFEFSQKINFGIAVLFLLGAFSFGLLKWQKIAPVGRGAVYSQIVKELEQNKNKLTAVISNHARVLNLLHLNQETKSVLPHFLFLSDGTLSLGESAKGHRGIGEVVRYREVSPYSLSPGVYALVMFGKKFDCRDLSKHQNYFGKAISAGSLSNDIQLCEIKN